MLGKIRSFQSIFNERAQIFIICLKPNEAVIIGSQSGFATTTPVPMIKNGEVALRYLFNYRVLWKT
jgi:hypothetical protein